MKKLSTSKIEFLALAFSALQAIAACNSLDTLEPIQGNSTSPVSHSTSGTTGDQGCTVTAVRYPTDEQDFQNLLYGNRGFLSVYDNIKHLGYDIIYAEGTAIHPIACGTIKFYGPATGYGTLVVVVEHKLANPLAVTNGDGTSTTFSTFLSIYGHQRTTPQLNGGTALGWKVGDTVKPEDIISYVQNDALNGDGPEHLHLGIRLQSAEAAKASDEAWFRGYDTAGAGQYKKYYTDPKTFIPALQASLTASDPGEGQADAGSPSQATHHPIGTLLQDVSSSQYWLVVDDGHILNVSGYSHLPKDCAVSVSSQVIGCYWQTQFDPFSLYLDAQVIKFQGEPQVYQLYPGNGFAPTKYRVFLSYDSFLSWGFKDSDIVEYPLSEKTAQIGSLENGGFAGFMPGSLVKGNDQSEVAVADQNGKRRPLFNWDVFQSLGYKSTCIYDIDSSTLDAVAGPRSDQIITLAETAECNAQGQACVPGSNNPCVCVGGVAGNQTCGSDGQSYSPCVCPSIEDSGAGGTGGQSGSGGQAGTGGTSATGGLGGFGGSAGQGGSQPTSYCLDAQHRACVTNQNQLCACSGGTSGVQACNQDCSGWDVCGCPQGGTGGSSGSSGTGGSQNTGGSGGSVYDAGTGTSGSGGTGGTGGSAQSGASGSGGATNDAGASASLCQAKGVTGKTTFILDAPITQTNVMSVYGWIHYPNWSGASDVAWSGWAWGTSSSTELVFQEGEAYQGAKYIFAPGLSSTAGQPQTAWYCEQANCPIGTFIVCNGLQEACRFQNGVLSGGASYTPNSANWQNMQCVLP